MLHFHIQLVPWQNIFHTFTVLLKLDYPGLDAPDLLFSWTRFSSSILSQKLITLILDPKFFPIKQNRCTEKMLMLQH